MKDGQPVAENPIISNPAGSQVSPIYAQRQMTYYPISESEYAALSSASTAATAYLSVASLLVSSSISIWASGIFYDQLNAKGGLAEQFVAPIVLIVGVVFAVMGIVSLVRKSSLWAEISGQRNGDSSSRR